MINKALMINVLGKSIKEYVHYLRYFLILVFLITTLETILIIKNFMPPTSFNILTIVKMFIIIVTGWNLRKNKFTQSQIIFSGLLVFLVGGWPIPFRSEHLAFTLAQRIITTSVLIMMNLIIYIILTLFGAWLSGLLLKHKNK